MGGPNEDERSGISGDPAKATLRVGNPGGRRREVLTPASRTTIRIETKVVSGRGTVTSGESSAARRPEESERRTD